MDSNYTTPIIIEFLNGYVSPIIIIFGLPGNILTALVFFRTDLKKHSSSFYLGSLAIADACYLVLLLNTVLEFYSQISIYNSGNFTCKMINYAVSVFSNWSVWLTVAFTTERYIALAYPLHRPVLCTVRKAKIITFFLFVVACGVNLNVIWLSGLDTEGWCTVIEESDKMYKVVNYVDTLLTSILPTITIIVLNSLIVRIVNRYRGNLFLRDVQHDDESVCASTRSYENTSERQSHWIGSGTSHQSDSKHAAVRERRTMMSHSQCNITKMILLTSTAFLVLNIPSYVMRFVITYYEDREYSLELIYPQRISYVLYQANFSVNFLLYAMYGTTFRKALRTFVDRNINAIKKCLQISPQ